MKRALLFIFSALIGLACAVESWSQEVGASSRFNSSTAEADSVILSIQAFQPGVPSPVAVRAIIRKSDGSLVPGEWMDPGWPRARMQGKAIGPEDFIRLPAGETEIVIGKGPDFYPITVRTNLSVPGARYLVKVELKPVFDLFGRGWRSGDLHVHYNHGENEIVRTPQETLNFCAAGGLQFVSLCQDHYGAGTLTRQQMLDVWSAFERSECKFWLGIEEPKNVWGHHVGLVYDPWAIRSSIPYSLGIEGAHQQGGVIVPVHPERIYPERFWLDEFDFKQYEIYPLNNHYKAFPLNALIGHLFDGWSGISDEAHNDILIDPYFKLLEMGYRIPLLADSDACLDRINNEIKAPGSFMSYYHLEGQPVTRASVANAMRQGRVMATTGPLVLFSIEGAMPGSTLVPSNAARTVRIDASYEFNQWTLGSSNFNNTEPCRITQIDLFRNGEPVRTWFPKTGRTNITFDITENSPNTWYMVRVLGNDIKFAAGYASPIYFDPSPRPRQPETFKALIEGRLYEAKTGAAVPGSVSCIRYGQTNWTINTDQAGLFQAYVPLDAQLVARDVEGREFTQNILQYEPAYRFLSYLEENFYGNKRGSVDAFKSVVSRMKWEFPLGHQPAGSYVYSNLTGDFDFRDISLIAGPEPLAGEKSTEVAMILVDKTRVMPGDVIHYAAIFRNPEGAFPPEELSVQMKGWHPVYPRMYGRFATPFHYNNSTTGHIDLGGGYFMRHGKAVVPDWAANMSETTAGIRVSVKARREGLSEEVSLLIPIGPTRRQLLVNTTYDGIPASWNETGLGPCNFYRDEGFESRYPDYRTMSVFARSPQGERIQIAPSVDTSHVADADDAAFWEGYYYDGQCEPEYRNIPFRDPVRTQFPVDFSSSPPVDQPDTTAPRPALMEPVEGSIVAEGQVAFYFFADDHGESGVHSSTIWLNGKAVIRATQENLVFFPLKPGKYNWRVESIDLAGNSALSETRGFEVVPSLAPLSIRKGASLEVSWPASATGFKLERTPVLRSDWKEVPDLGVVSNGMHVIHLEPSEEATFLRLRSPGENRAK